MLSTRPSPVPITSGYTEPDAGFYNPALLWYDRKRTHAALEPYPMMDSSYYGQFQPPSAKYMKPEPVAYYQYAEDPERYQANITVSVQSQAHSTFGTPATSAMAYLPPHYSYSSSPYCSAAVTDTTSIPYSSHSSLSTNPAVTCVNPRPMHNCSPVRRSTEEASVSLGDHGMTTPLTPPLSVSPVAPVSASPTPPQSISPVPNTYFEKDNTIGYRSGSTSPCVIDCDSTTAAELLDNGMIPKLPLQVLSDLSEGLPLPGM